MKSKGQDNVQWKYVLTQKQQGLQVLDVVTQSYHTPFYAKMLSSIKCGLEDKPPSLTALTISFKEQQKRFIL